MRQARPAGVRPELTDMVRRLDLKTAAEELCDELVPAPASSGSGLTPDGLRILAALDRLKVRDGPPGEGC
jgi:RNA polymerase sigma-70 factor (ECF subfamily)